MTGSMLLSGRLKVGNRLTIRAAIELVPGGLSDIVGNQTGATIAKAHIDSTGMETAGLSLPVRPIVRQIIVRAAHSQRAEARQIDRSRLHALLDASVVAVFDIVGI